MKCTGLNCPMQCGYDVANCEIMDCKYRTRPMTNFEKIKAMSVEEMAEIIMCPYQFDHEKKCNLPIDCLGCCKEWLESEVQEDE